MLRAVSNADGIQVLARSAVAVACPNDLLENTLATITVPAGAMGPNGRLRITVDWSWTANANAKTTRVRFGGASGTTYLSGSPTTQTPSHVVIDICNVNSVSSQKGTSTSMYGSNLAANSATTSAVDTSAATTIVITGQKAVAGDVLTLESYLVELIPGA